MRFVMTGTKEMVMGAQTVVILNLALLVQEEIHLGMILALKHVEMDETLAGGLVMMEMIEMQMDATTLLATGVEAFHAYSITSMGSMLLSKDLGGLLINVTKSVEMDGTLDIMIVTMVT